MLSETQLKTATRVSGYGETKRDREVELAFSSKNLREICESRGTAISAVGEDAARELADRLADMDAAANVSELRNLFPKDLVEPSPTQLLMRLKSGYGLKFCAGHVSVPKNNSGTTDWDKVTRIKILALEKISG